MLLVRTIDRPESDVQSPEHWGITLAAQRPLLRLAEDIAGIEPRRLEGRVTGVSGLLIEAAGPGEALTIGAGAVIDGPKPARAQIVGFRGDRALLLPFETVTALRPGARVRLDSKAQVVRPSSAWLATNPCSADLRYQLAARTGSRGTPSPSA